MKKIFLLLTVVASAFFTSCNNDDNVNFQDNDTIAEVFEIRNVNFMGSSGYEIFYEFGQFPIFDSDMILVYRLAAVENGRDVWELLPKTVYFNDGTELDYNFDFTTQDIRIYMSGTLDLASVPEFTQNQLFRVVIVPGFLSNRGGNSFDASNYQSVIDFYGINDKNPTQLIKR
ncbi:hypothetical protein GV828_08600 [Flavobacterium sp. NST-5]|uniref:Lipoprotein n=1 Tax=Flavobacterium ichthyis TaxID=2698827 RepID=A0ABW9Z8Q9_9FLAO|nr:hypothetical protein [Flavobacterium ichthyis]NBL65252.1 hypothetical protein [Flavobacterium ichthyis]